MDANTMTILSTSWASGAPLVRIRNGSDKVSSLTPLRGLELRYEATGERVCLGHKPFRTPGVDYVDCQQRPVPGSRRCRSCTSIEAAFAANLHHAHTRDSSTIDLAVAEHLRQSNVLYLAAFADGTTKVGTSTEQRLDVRLSEQGAWVARIVAEAVDGVVVRELEDRVSAETGLSQAVSVRRKMDGLLDPVSFAELEIDLDLLQLSVHDVVAKMGDDGLSPVSRPWEHPVARNDVWRKTYLYPFRLDAGEHNFTVVEACGRVIAVRRPDASGQLSTDVFIADLGGLYGAVIESGQQEAPEITLQDTLF